MEFFNFCKKKPKNKFLYSFQHSHKSEPSIVTVCYTVYLKKIISILITDYLGGKVACFSTPSSVAFTLLTTQEFQIPKIVKDIHKTVQNQLYPHFNLAILGQKKN